MRCEHCSADNAVSRCSECPQTFYCNQKCQQSNWAQHKLICGNGARFFAKEKGLDLLEFLLGMVAQADVEDLISVMETETISSVVDRVHGIIPQMLGSLQSFLKNTDIDTANEPTLAQLFLRVASEPHQVLLEGLKDLTLDPPAPLNLQEFYQWRKEKDAQEQAAMRRAERVLAEQNAEWEAKMRALDAEYKERARLNKTTPTQAESIGAAIETVTFRTRLREQFAALQHAVRYAQRPSLAKVIGVGYWVLLILGFCMLATVGISTVSNINTVSAVDPRQLHGQPVPLDWKEEFQLLMGIRDAPLRWVRTTEESPPIREELEVLMRMSKDLSERLVKLEKNMTKLKAEFNAEEAPEAPFEPPPLEPIPTPLRGDVDEIEELEQKIRVLQRKNNPRLQEKLNSYLMYLAHLTGATAAPTTSSDEKQEALRRKREEKKKEIDEAISELTQVKYTLEDELYLVEDEILQLNKSRKLFESVPYGEPTTVLSRTLTARDALWTHKASMALVWLYAWCINQLVRTWYSRNIKKGLQQ